MDDKNFQKLPELHRRALEALHEVIQEGVDAVEDRKGRSDEGKSFTST